MRKRLRILTDIAYIVWAQRATSSRPLGKRPAEAARSRELGRQWLDTGDDYEDQAVRVGGGGVAAEEMRTWNPYPCLPDGRTVADSLDDAAWGILARDPYPPVESFEDVPECRV